MKILVDKLPDSVVDCPFFRYDVDWAVGRCTLTGNLDIVCTKYSEDECESCITFNRYLKGENK